MRPGQRSLTRLPALSTRKAELETCVYCPKLCRGACPVSNAEPSEALIPWGKMASALYMARGDAPTESGGFGETAWACTGCMGCRDMCDHKNPVADTLLDTRAALFRDGHAPSAAQEIVRAFENDERAHKSACQSLSDHPNVNASSRTGIFFGGGYATALVDVARDAIRAAAFATGGSVRVLTCSSGATLLAAGDATGFERHAAAVTRELDALERVIVVDADCAFSLAHHYPRHGLAIRPTVETLVGAAASAISRWPRIEYTASVRYHDPCKLSRGLGIRHEPRSLIERITGKRPEEFEHVQNDGGCSGGGNLLDRTWPDVASRIADMRLREHEERGGGDIVTACASSIVSLRHAAARIDTKTRVIDVASLLAKSAAQANGRTSRSP